MTSHGILRTKNLAGRFVVCAFFAAASLALNGCDLSEKTRQVVDQRSGEAQQSLESARKQDTTGQYRSLVVSDKVWNGSTALHMQHGMPLPARYETPRGITLISADPMSMNDIINAIGAQTGIPLRLSAMALGGKAAAAAPAATPSFSPSSFGGGVPSSAASSTSHNATDGEEPMPMSYEGPLSGLLDRVGAYFGVTWRYDGSSIMISRYQTRIFSVEALPGTQEINEGMQDDNSSAGGSSSSSGGGTTGSTTSSGGSGGSSTNTLTQNSKFTMGFKYWEELTQVLTAIVGGQGSVVVSPSIGTVTVTATPETLEIVADYLAKENKRLSRQIAINVQIYSVNLGQSEDFNIAFTGFLKNLSKFSGLNYTSAGTPSITNPIINSTSSGFGSLGIAILNGPNDPTAHAGDVFNALSTIGDTTSVAQFPMTTLNNRPVSRRVGTDTSYVSSITQNTTTSTAESNIVTPTVSTIHAGFSLQLTPRVLDDGRILLQYSLSLIENPGNPPTATFSGNEITLPVTNNRIFVQQSVLRSGSTLILGGVDQEDMAQNKQGVGSPDNFLLGGGVSSYNSHFMMFMAITPQVMDVGGEEHS